MRVDSVFCIGISLGGWVVVLTNYGGDSLSLQGNLAQLLQGFLAKLEA